MIEPLTHDEIEQIIWDHWNTQGGSCRECGIRETEMEAVDED